MAQRPSQSPSQPQAAPRAAATARPAAPATPLALAAGAPSQRMAAVSHLLMASALLLMLWHGLLPGLLCVCLGFLLTRRLASALARALTLGRAQHQPGPALLRAAQTGAAGLVMLLPLALLAAGLTQSRGYSANVPQQYQELLHYMARTVLELRLKLPAEMAAYLPEGIAEIQRAIAAYLASKAGAVAVAAGRAWLAGLLSAYVGLLVGALAAVRTPLPAQGPLARQLQLRIALFGEAFGQIVAAQFSIAAFNALLTALFLLFVLPLWDLRLPYTTVLISFTFVAGLVPIVGNLVCNVVITIVGLSVAPLAAAACLAFLILIHKAEFLINARVVGRRTQMGVWELLGVMFVAKAIFGPAGLVAAPLYYAYLKKELIAARLV